MPAETAVREWINSQPSLVGEGRPLSRGAFLASQRSPADGAFAVLHRTASNLTDLVAEDDGVHYARISAAVRAGTEEAAEEAAVALAEAIRSLRGCPEPMGDTGYIVLASAYLTGPDFQAGDAEPYAYQVAADFIMRPA